MVNNTQLLNNQSYNNQYLNSNEVIATKSRNTNQLLVPQAENAIDQMKYEIAQEMGVELGADQTARNNGRVGGEMTKRLVALGQKALEQQNNNIH